MTEKQTCAACGNETGVLVWVGDMRLCRLCSSSENRQAARRIVKHRHHGQLEAILSEMEKI